MLLRAFASHTNDQLENQPDLLNSESCISPQGWEPTVRWVFHPEVGAPHLWLTDWGRGCMWPVSPYLPLVVQHQKHLLQLQLLFLLVTLGYGVGFMLCGLKQTAGR